MKLKSSAAKWATVFCTAAVFSSITLCDAQAGRIRSDILPPPQIDGGSGTVETGGILPPPHIDDSVASTQTLNGDFRGTLIVDWFAGGSPHGFVGTPSPRIKPSPSPEHARKENPRRISPTGALWLNRDLLGATAELDQAAAATAAAAISRTRSRARCADQRQGSHNHQQVFHTNPPLSSVLLSSRRRETSRRDR